PLMHRRTPAPSFEILVLSQSPAIGETPPSAAFTPAEMEKILRHSPLPPVPDDPSNAVATSRRAARLGQRLFYDTRGSASGIVSCATCHDPKRDWSNGRNVGTLDARFPRNVPSLWNIAYGRWFFWDGRADSMWAQALGPMENPVEMNGNRLGYARLVRNDRRLKRRYERVFGPLPDLDDALRFPRVAKPTPPTPDEPANLAWLAMTKADRESIDRVFSNLGKAIAAYERALISTDSPFDRFVRDLRAGAASPGGLDESAQRGLKLFVGKGQCSICHSGPNFTDREFHDLGRPSGYMRRDPGRAGGYRLVVADPFNRLGLLSDSTSGALVRFVPEAGGPSTQAIGQFKTPTLRSVAQTAPYMHDGRITTLRDVAVFYS